MPYAVIEVAGKQFHVEENMSIQVPRLDREEGEEIRLEGILLYSDGENVTTGTPLVENVDVRAKVTGHGKGAKITVFKMKRRKTYRKKVGMRPLFTVLEITRVARSQRNIPETAPEVGQERG